MTSTPRKAQPRRPSMPKGPPTYPRLRPIRLPDRKGAARPEDAVPSHETAEEGAARAHAALFGRASKLGAGPGDASIFSPADCRRIARTVKEIDDDTAAVMAESLNLVLAGAISVAEHDEAAPTQGELKAYYERIAGSLGEIISLLGLRSDDDDPAGLAWLRRGAHLPVADADDADFWSLARLAAEARQRPAGGWPASDPVAAKQEIEAALESAAAALSVLQALAQRGSRVEWPLAKKKSYSDTFVSEFFIGIADVFGRTFGILKPTDNNAEPRHEVVSWAGQVADHIFDVVDEADADMAPAIAALKQVRSPVTFRNRLARGLKLLNERNSRR